MIYQKWKCTLHVPRGKLVNTNLRLCAQIQEPPKVPNFYYIALTSKSAIFLKKILSIVHYKPQCMLFRFTLLFFGPKSGTKQGLTVYGFFGCL